MLFVLGQGAITSLVFTEKIAGFSKKRNEEIQRTECRENEKKNKTHQNVSDAMEEEMGLVAAADAERVDQCNSRGVCHSQEVQQIERALNGPQVAGDLQEVQVKKADRILKQPDSRKFAPIRTTS